MHDIRKLTLWGNLMAGGAGVEYYFGYALPENDLVCEDFRSRDKSWDCCRIALEFFTANKVPFWAMQNADALIGNAKNDNSRFCLAQPGKLYLVYLPNGGSTELNLTGVEGTFEVRWFNPREGGPLRPATPTNLRGGAKTTLTAPDQEDWLAVIK